MFDLDPYIVAILSSRQDSSPVGAGFFITSAGHILTCYHVIKNPNDIWVSWSGMNQPVKAEFCRETSDESDRMDFAILKISLDDNITLPPKLSIDPSYKHDDPIIGKGYQSNSHDNLSPADGYILGEEERDGYKYISLKDARYVDEGLSGSPALNTSTEKVIGIFSEQGLKKESIDGINQLSDKYAYIIPIDSIAKELSSRAIHDDHIKKFINLACGISAEIKLSVHRTTIKNKESASIEWIFSNSEDDVYEYAVDINKDAITALVVALDDYLKNMTHPSKLRKLAVRGSQLFEMIFTSNNDDEEIVRKAKNCKHLLKRSMTHKNIIITRTDFDIPWNCMYINDYFQEINADYFLGNKYNIVIKTGYDSFPKKNNKHSNYAAHDYEIKCLCDLKLIIENKFEKIVHLECGNGKNKEISNNNKIKVIKCGSLDNFCDAILDTEPQLLFICFNEGFMHSSSNFLFKKECAVIKIGKLDIYSNKLRSGLSELQGKPIFVIIVGGKTDHKVRLEFKKIFISDLKWKGMIFMDGNVRLDFAVEYLCKFLEKFTKNEHKRSADEVLFEIHKKYKSDEEKRNIGLAFTAYLNTHIDDGAEI